jgi:hypothetical protein
VRPVPVRGHLGGGVRPVQLTRTEQVGEGVGEGGVQAGPFAGQQVSVDHLTEQGVTEKVRYARLLVDALELTSVPRPLDRVLAHI